VAVRVAVLDDYQGASSDFGDWTRLSEGSEVVAFREHIADDAELVARLAGFDVVVAMRERTPFPRARLERLPDLRLLVTTGPFNAVIDVAAARELGIVLVGTGGILTPTSELTWALILSLARQIGVEDADVRSGGWQRTVGTDLAGRTLGLLGLGNLGSMVAKVGQAFGMRVIAWSQNLTPARAEERGVEAVERDELFAQSDFLSIHLVLSDRTRGLVDARAFDLMKPTAYLVNTSRGPIVDEAALVAALESGAIAGAALDVFDEEPLPLDHPYRSLPKLVVTPHIGYVTRDCYTLFFDEIVDDICAYEAGTPVRVIEPR
jgi:phosphoglycerate dehydrogenase-like enzyme